MRRLLALPTTEERRLRKQRSAAYEYRSVNIRETEGLFK